jgi:glycosyltransferase involved in cell wall biosynthesis
MPARNVGPFVGAAIQSILDQRFEDFELIIRDDGSTDETSALLRDWARRDARIRLFQGERLGLAGSSNWIVRRARAPLVARMDADDIARTDRLGRQLQVLREDRSILLVGSLADTIDRAGRKIRDMDVSQLVRRSWFAPFPHTSVMFRRDAFDAIGGYRQLPYCEDWDFFLRLSNAGRIVVIADALVSHRVVNTSSSAAPDYHEKVVAGLDHMLAALPSTAGGHRYRPLAFPAACGVGGRPRVHPLAIIFSWSPLLWSGGSPRPLGELMRRGRLRLNAISITALGWALLCQLSPRALRNLLRGLALGRRLGLRHRVKRGRAYVWTPGGRT